MSQPRCCPKCRAELPADAPQGLCPKCLLQAAWDSQSEDGPNAEHPQAGASNPATDPTRLTASGFVPPSPESLAPLFPQLEILELLGKGGMGAVYKARQPGLDRLVAVKILPPEISHDPAFAERFQREARALARLSHPHIVAVYDFGQTSTPLAPLGRGAGGEGSLCYIVMEFVDGANLRQTIQTGTLTSAEALAIVPQICEALQFAHDEGIVHRDIKPENILIDKRGRVKIADFGLAKLLGQDAGDRSLTATHQVMGTLRYMAPEQMQGSREVDHRADIYSLGVVFYELLTGELPMGRFAPPSKRVQVDVRLDEVVLRALEQNPEQRYQHASEVKTDVEAVVRGKPMATPTINRMNWQPLATELGTFADHPKGAATEPHLVQAPADCLLLAAGTAFVTACGVTTWLGATASRENNFTTSMIHGNLIGMSIGLAFYSVFVSIAGLMMRRLRARLFVLLVDVIVGLFFPAVVALNVLLELRNIPVWPVVIPLWIGMPAALWVAVTLFRDDVRHAFAAAEQRRLRGFGKSPQQTPSTASPPRFSRFAIIGAVWALFGLLAVIPTLFFTGLNRVWNGTALPTDLIHEQPPLAFTIFMGALLAIGAGAPIGTTIYGAISIGHIKRSGGKVVGLPLAVVDMLFFPLLVVFAGIALPVSLALHALLPLQMIAVAVPSAMLALVVCLVIGFAVWCKVIPDSPLAAITLREKLRLAGIVLLIAGIMDAFCGLVWIGQNVSGLVELLKQGAPIGWQVAATCLSLGSAMLVYYVIGVGMHLMTLEDDGDFTFCLLIAAIAPPGCLIGLPAAIYAMVQLTKPEVKALIPKQQSEPQTPAPTNEVQHGVRNVASEPRLSRLALAGAIWGGLGLMGLILAVFLTSYSESGPSAEMSKPPESLRILGLVILTVTVALGASSVFGTTICGAVAIDQIKHSGGKLYGLRLAAADALLFPLLIVGFAASAVTHIAQIAIWTKTHTGYVYNAGILADIIAPNPANRPDMVFLILDALVALVALVVCFFVGRAAWRATVARIP
ncbi:MAG: serine/threonine-protein kinase [Planctomycetota bacterium]